MSDTEMSTTEISATEMSDTEMSEMSDVRIGALLWRILFFGLTLTVILYTGSAESQGPKVVPIDVAIGVAAGTMSFQICNGFLAYCSCLPYSFLVSLGIDGLCTAAWIPTVALLARWRSKIYYAPREGDPAEWFECERSPYSMGGWDGAEIVRYNNVVWCEAEVDGQRRMIASSAAMEQFRVVLGLSCAILFFFLLFIVYLIWRGKVYGLVSVNWPKLKRRGGPGQSKWAVSNV